MNPVLMRCIIELLIFLELADDDVLDPDVAVRQQEQQLWLFRQLGPDERRAFVSFIHEMAESEEQRSGSERRLKVLREMPRAMGLTDAS